MIKIIIAIILFSTPAYADCFHAVAGVGNVPCSEEFIEQRAVEVAEWTQEQAEREKQAALEAEKAALEKDAPEIMQKAIEALAAGEPLPAEYLTYKEKQDELKATEP